MWHSNCEFEIWLRLGNQRPHECRCGERQLGPHLCSSRPARRRAAITLTATAHTLEIIDTGSILETTGASSVTLTIPDEASVPFEAGTLINVTQVGAGVATVQAAAGVSLNGVVGGAVALSGQWAGAALTKRGADAWVIQGALAGAVT